MSPAKTERPRVRHLALELTAYCNQKCHYCYNAWRGAPPKRIEASELAQTRRLERLFSAWQIGSVTLTGGEPLASHELFPILELVRSEGSRAQLISNGGLISSRSALRLAEFEPSFVQITLNGASAESHEAHVGAGHFAPTLRGVELLKQHGVNVVGSIVVTAQNAREIGAIISLWQSLGVTQIALSRFSPAGYAVEQIHHLLPSRSDLLSAFTQAQTAYTHSLSAGSPLDLRCTLPIPPCALETELFSGVRFSNCPIGTAEQEFVLGTDGRLRNCTLHRAPIGPEASDILDPQLDLVALLRSPDITQYRRERPEFCSGCIHEETCSGGCGASSAWVLGHARRFPDPLVSQYIDPDFKARLSEARRSLPAFNELSTKILAHRGAEAGLHSPTPSKTRLPIL